MNSQHYEDSAAAVADALNLHRDEIAQHWASLVTKNIDSAAKLSEFVLYNFFPHLIDQIASALKLGLLEFMAIQKSTSSEEHGGERARLTSYNIKQVAAEFYYLKLAIFHCLDSKQPISNEIRDVIGQVVDLSMQRSLTAFALAESAIREQFIAMLAHDIRGPVSFIKMSLSLLGDEPLPPSQEALTSRMSAAAEDALELIDNILDASVITGNRRIKLGIQQVNIEDVIEETTRNVQAEVRIHSGPIVGYWCPKSLKRALKNVLENAINYGDGNAPIQIHVSSEYDALKIAVHNEGTPIPAIEQENIFQPYWRAKDRDHSKTQGWGFGLPIVRGVVEAHGGFVSVESDEGHGTTFNLVFPLDARPYQQIPN